jgi:hypothetical protein
MRKKARFTKTDYPNGATRQKRVFAWLPTYVSGEIVWLEYFEVLQAYIIEEISLRLDGKDQLFAVASWRNISKRLI